MRFKTIFSTLGLILMLVGLSKMLPVTFAILYRESGELVALLLSMIITVTTGAVIYRVTKSDSDLTNKEGIIIGAIGWLVIPFFGCLPYIFSGVFVNWFDAYFEAVSGFSTTGATVLTDIEIVPKSILLWRSFTQWLGGMGILLVFVAIIPRPGIGSTRLLKAETPGPMIFKIVPRISQYAKYIWIVYVVLTLVEIIILCLVGLNFFEAMNHTFTSIATGGFSTRNDGISAFENIGVELVVILFMIIGGGNFVAYYILFVRRDFLLFFKDEEYKAYLLVLLVGAIIVITNLQIDFSDSTLDNVRFGLFQVISLKTGTGHVSFDYNTWNNMILVFLFLLMFFGGCQYSTTGGIKMVRMLIAIRFIRGEITKNLHPNVVHQVRINNSQVQSQVVLSVIGFFLLYFIFFFLTALLLAAYGYDMLSSITASAAMLGNVGPAMGVFGPMHNYSDLSNVMKIWLSIIMVTGRLEIYPMLALFQVIFSPKER